ncbi:hypothetical protein [Dactylosporangium sp. NPDC005555]|uniref:hypothetical protein n=1 Tax=Dactylosporangium sp. NPDC005555 TaxID=3154889 RepID=UPI0033B7E796
MRLLTLAAGLATGYVLGTRAGRGKYEQIVEGARQLRANPTFAQASATAKHLATAPGTKATLTPPAAPPAATPSPAAATPSAATAASAPADAKPRAPRRAPGQGATPGQGTPAGIADLG